MSDNIEPTKRHWSNYPMTVARRIARNFPELSTGADIAMSSDLPAASGLSSSSAMIIGCFLVIAGLNQLDSDARYLKDIHNPQDLAGYLGCVENGQSFHDLTGDKGVGTFGGSQDHTAILCCKPNKLGLFSFCPVKLESEIPFAFQLRFIIADSGVIAEKTGEALVKYNLVSARGRKLVQVWNETHASSLTCLREVLESSEGASALLNKLVGSDSMLVSRLNQFIQESEHIIPHAAVAFAKQDWKTLQHLVNASQAGAETDLHNQVQSTIALQRQLLQSGAIAASAFGAGFGGSVWGLYHESDVDQALRTFPNSFATRPGCAAMEIVGS